jgi:hypothetical protein
MSVRILVVLKGNLPMADDKCVGVKCEVKNIFERDFAKPVCKEMQDTIESLVNKTKGLKFERNCRDGWMLTATVLSLDVDDPGKPTQLSLKLAIDGVPLSGTAKGFNATGNGKVSGLRPKKMEEETTSIVQDVISDTMYDKVLPLMSR